MLSKIFLNTDRFGAMAAPLGSLSQCWTSFQWRTFSKYPVWSSPDAALSHSLLSFHQILQKRDQHHPLHFSWGHHRQKWGHPSLTSSPSWTNLVSSATPPKSCPLVLSPSLLPSFGHMLIFSYPSYILMPKFSHTTWGEAAPRLTKVIPEPAWE